MYAIAGSVLNSEFKQGGEGDRAYSYYSLSVLVGKDEIIKVKADPQRVEAGAIPQEGERIHADVTIRAYKDRNGAAQLACALVRYTVVEGGRKAA